MAVCLSRLRHSEASLWSLALLRSALCQSTLAIIGKFPKSLKSMQKFLTLLINVNMTGVRRVLWASLLLSGLLFVIVPLLCSADSLFNARVGFVVEWVTFYFSWNQIWKILFALISSVIFVAVVDVLNGSLHENKIDTTVSKDSLVAGVVLIGVLLVYLFFIAVQIERLWVNSLPQEFRDVEYMVKSGFWQLIFLSFLNSILFINYYRVTNKVCHYLLTAFAVSALLLVCSAAHRVVLYVFIYGLSYEKFYALYATIFCGVLMSYLAIICWRRKRMDVVKFAFNLFVGMYTLVSVLPVERFVLSATIKLAKLEGTRISLRELTMLSIYAYPVVMSANEQGLLSIDSEKRTHENYDSQSGYIPPESDASRWYYWTSHIGYQYSSKRWFELTLSDLLYARTKKQV